MMLDVIEAHIVGTALKYVVVYVFVCDAQCIGTWFCSRVTIIDLVALVYNFMTG